MRRFASIAQPGNGEARALWAEPNEMARNCVGAADRYDHDALRGQIPPMEAGERLECDLIADAFDQYD